MTALVDRDRYRHALGAATAIGVHAGAAALIFIGVGHEAARPAAPAAQMMVEVAALPSAPPAPPSLAPPEPEQIKAQPRPVEVRLDIPPPPQIALAVTPAVVVPIAARTTQNDRSAKSVEETTSASAPAAPVADAARAPAIGAPSVAARAAEQTWEARVLAQLERKKRYPDAARRGRREDVVYISIRLDPAGHLVDGQIRRSRGFDDLNNEVMALVRRASPYPAPPAALLGGRTDIALLVPVEFFLNRTGNQ